MPMIPILLVVFMPWSAATARADLFFPTKASLAGSPVVTVGSLGIGATIDGKSFGGMMFGDTEGRVSSLFATIRDLDGTNNLTGPSIIGHLVTSVPSTFLTITFDEPVGRFGFKFAISDRGTFIGTAGASIPNGPTLMEDAAFDSQSDPHHSGGCVGIGSTTPFPTARLRFASGLSFASEFRGQQLRDRSGRASSRSVERGHDRPRVARLGEAGPSSYPTSWSGIATSLITPWAGSFACTRGLPQDPANLRS